MNSIDKWPFSDDNITLLQPKHDSEQQAYSECDDHVSHLSGKILEY